jgi:hypothetical protein
MPNVSNSYDLSSLGATPVDAAPSSTAKPQAVQGPYDLSSLGAKPIKSELPSVSGAYGSMIAAGTGASDVIADALRAAVLTGGEISKGFGGKGDYAQAISDWIKAGEHPIIKGHNLARLAGELTGGGVEAVGASMIPGMGLSAGEGFGSKLLTSAAKGAVGGGVLGATQMPEEKIRGAELGAAFGVPMEMVPSALRGSISKLKPGALTSQEVSRVLDSISGGRELEPNARSIASDIKDSYNKILKEGKGYYKKITDKVKDTPIYEMYRGIPKADYLNMDKSIIDGYSPDIKAAHSAFLEKPTFENAHKLQNTLGSEAKRGYKNPFLNLQDRQTLGSFSKARKMLKGDIDDFLRRADTTGKMADDYKYASDFHKNEVMPYRDTARIRDIAKEKVINPRNISTIFKNPEADVQKVVDDIGPGLKDKIVYNELGKVGKDASPEKLIKAYDSLDKKGLGSYITPSLDEHMEALRSKVAQSILVKRGVGALIGSGILHGIPIPGAGEAAGAIGGAILGPKLFGRGLGRAAAVGASLAGQGEPFYRTSIPRSLIPSMIRAKKRGELK